MSDLALVQWDSLRLQIESASDIVQFKDMSNKLEALRVLARQSKESLETQNRIAEYRLRVERRKGEWLDEHIPKGALPGTNNRDVRASRLTLQEAGVGREESRRARSISRMSEKEFEKFLSIKMEAEEEITMKAILMIARRRQREAKREVRREKSAELVGQPPDLHHGDCRELIPTLKNDSIDCLVTDPPYGLAYEGQKEEVLGEARHVGRFHKTLAGDEDFASAAALLDEMLEAVVPKLKTGAHAYIFCSWKNFSLFEEVVKRHLEMRNLIVWVKNNWGVGDCLGNWAEQHELVIYASKGRSTTWCGEGRPINVLFHDRIRSEVHPTEKPESLLREFIEVATYPGEVVLDPFMGVGSTILAAHDLGRRGIGIEIDEDYYLEASRRLVERG